MATVQGMMNNREHQEWIKRDVIGRKITRTLIGLSTLGADDLFDLTPGKDVRNESKRKICPGNEWPFFLSSFRKFSSTDGIYICESDRIQLIFGG